MYVILHKNVIKYLNFFNINKKYYILNILIIFLKKINFKIFLTKNYLSIYKLTNILTDFY